MKSAFFIFLIIIIGYRSLAQVDDLEYNQELIWGINKNTSSWLIGGLILRKTDLIRKDTYRTIGLELINIRNPKEVKGRNSIGTFVIEKYNYLFAIRPQIGIEKILYKKAEQQGVQVSTSLAAGPSIGLLIPYYLQIESNRYVRYNSLNSSTFTPAGPFVGLPDTKFLPGINLKGSLSFEHSAFKSSISGIELGFLVDAYLIKAQIMTETVAQGDKSIFPTLFINLYYGNRK